MKRDLSTITRDLESKKNNDIIYKKDAIKRMFIEDPDILEILGEKEPRPLNKYKDPDNPTDEELKERAEILSWNEKITHDQIVPYLKLNGIKTEVQNFIMFDIEDNDVSYTNNAIKVQQLVVMILVHENDMETEYGVVRTDLLGYLVKDILSWTNDLGMQLKMINDYVDIVDAKYYCRTIKFRILAPNEIRYGRENRYDNF